MDGDSEGDEDIEEIDFADIGKLQAAIDSAAAQTRHLSKSTLEEKFTGFYIDTTPAPISETVAHNFTGRILGEDSDDDEVIVYEAPNPRAGPPTPPIEQDRPTTQILPPADSQSLESSIVTPQVDGATKAQFPITAESGEPKSTESGVVQDIPTSAVGNPHNAKTLPIISPGDIAPFNIPVEINSSPHRDVAMDADPEANISPLANLTPNVLASLMPAANLGGPESLTSIDKDLTHSGTVDVLGQAPSLQPPDKPVPSSSTHSGSKIPPAPSFEDVTFKLLASAQKTYQRKIHPVGTPRSLLRNSRRSKKMRRSFAALGASLSEAHLREGVDGKEVDPRKNEQRRGDSDVDWGDATSDEDEQVGVKNRNGKGRAQEEEEGIEEVMNGVDGMMVDDDYNLNSMKSFVASMSTEGSRFKTMDDLADEEKMKKEDLESDSNVGSQEKETEAEDAVDAETTDEMEEEEEEDSSDEEETAESGFQARLRKIRSRKKGKTRANEDEDEDDMYISLDEDWEQEDEADILAQEVQVSISVTCLVAPFQRQLLGLFGRKRRNAHGQES